MISASREANAGLIAKYFAQLREDIFVLITSRLPNETQKACNVCSSDHSDLRVKKMYLSLWHGDVKFSAQFLTAKVRCSELHMSLDAKR